MADDVVDDEEVPGHAQPGDHVEFVAELPPRRCGVRVFAPSVAGGAGVFGETAQPGVLVVSLGGGEARQLGVQEAEIDHAGATEVEGGFRDAGVAGQPPCHFLVGAQVGGRGRHQVSGGSGEGFAAA